MVPLLAASAVCREWRFHENQKKSVVPPVTVIVKSPSMLFSGHAYVVQYSASWSQSSYHHSFGRPAQLSSTGCVLWGDWAKDRGTRRSVRR